MIESLKVSAIDESASNPRQRFHGLEELAEDLKRHGMLQAVLVRPGKRASRYELVFGARRLRAAKLAGLEEIPASSRELDDVEVLELQVVENQQREDVHPLEEALGYEQLHLTHGLPVDEIAAKVGKSRAYVYGRMRLTALCGFARDQFLEGELSASAALLVARIPNADDQKRATRQILDLDRPAAYRHPMTYKAAKRLIHDSYMMQLKGAPFALDDADLVPKAGACIACPKRTGNQRELFDDVKSADVCTDPPCFHRKVEADQKRTLEQAKARGDAILPLERSRKIFHPGEGVLRYDAPFVDLAARSPEHGTTWNRLIGKQKPPIVIAVDRQGKAHRLVKRADAAKALEAAGHRPKRARGAGGPTPQERRKQRIDAETRRRAMGAMVEAVEQMAKPSPGVIAVLQIALQRLCRATWSDTIKDIARRRGIVERGFKGEVERAVAKAISETADGRVLMGWLAEMSIWRFANHHADGGSFKKAAEALDVDLVEIRREVTAEIPPARKAARKKASAQKTGRKKTARKKTSRKRSANKARRTKRGR